MEKNVVMLLTAALALTLAGCKEKVHTVEWFKEHEAEREAQLAKCQSNPGELAETPNCINAGHAASSLLNWGSIFAPFSAAPAKTEDNNK